MKKGSWWKLNHNESVEISGVHIHPVDAFADSRALERFRATPLPWPDTWYSDLVNRAIPEMGEKYMCLFIDCGFRPDIFFLCCDNEEWARAITAATKEIRNGKGDIG